MRCARCGVHVETIDSYCRQCGAALNRRNLPTILSRSFLPVPWEMVRGPVKRGVAALVLGTAVELVRRGITRQIAGPEPGDALALLAQVGEPSTNGKNGRFPWSRAPKGEYEVTETVIQRTRRWVKR